ncbi:universal stress protein (plasmid) [Acaryochloris sp. 'Moss Beach']|uniref:universal stress protein n=1 Tax=Acaryochloris TaxID=155977 RepID=UPI001BB0505B|nr:MULTISPECIES: universal stress protein [Acaryochloris]QUY45993.1 universal stress protein [Acaryochloris marina S15]UJB72656.1 universal stress protein [Acaryochloris sp. 'Moss Beach']
MGYERIFVAMDASSLQFIVYERALETAKLHQAELMFLHCIEVEVNPSGTSAAPIVGIPVGASVLSPSADDFQITKQTWSARLAETKLWLQEYCRKAEQQGVKATFEAIMGTPENQVCNLAQIWQADLIIVGRHGRTGLTEFFLGSVSNYVVHHAHCSVLVVQGKGVVSSKSI